ncbi:MAG: ABC transporter ATP-binding protein [Chloroflexi bacterium]|nr:ABC transporter ATP-binding protein [Chloroflexota bacterium]MCI0645838.1 ABC transporter ATP-binding protein [Chloroflexota bacterium]MCI0725693.1 ABC transporter ATP-binding protein [Chloroflexota bacterium]
MSPIIEVRNLHKQYNPPDGIVAVKDVSFEIHRGEIFSLLGPNGAGKTTTISMLACLLAPSGGDAIIDGHSINTAVRQVKQVIGLVPQEVAIYNTISARENLVFWGKMYGLTGRRLHERVAAALEIAGISDRADDKVSTFSGGMKRRLNVAIGLLHEPKILYLDEPTVGIDPQSRRRILDTVKELKERGVTVLYTTHYMEEAQELSDRIGIIDHGELIAIGTLDELTKTLGQYDTIRLDLDDNLLEKDALVASLSAISTIDRIYSEDGHIVLQARNANEVLPHVFRQLSAAGGNVRQLKIQEPNLEAVFLHLTGRALRD